MTEEVVAELGPCDPGPEPEEFGPGPVPGDRIDLPDLLERAEAYVRRFVSMTPAQSCVYALWVAHTHVPEASDFTPYINVTSPTKQCGKSRTLEVGSYLAGNPWKTSGATPAAILRTIHKKHPTAFIDESDAAFNGDKDRAEALRGLLNAGFQRGGTYTRCVGQGSNQDPVDFDTFCPKAIAGIGRLPDTVSSRSITIQLQRQRPGQKVEKFRERKHGREGQLIAAGFGAWSRLAVAILKDAQPTIPDGLTDRQEDILEPLLAIADMAGGEWPERARFAIVELAGNVPDDGDLSIRLLVDIRLIFNEKGVDRISSADLCAALISIDEAPWKEVNRGKPINANRLSRLLNPYGIVSGSIRLADGTTPKGYYLVSFADIWGRYLPSPSAPQSATPPQTNTGGGFLDFSNRHTEQVVAVSKRGIVNTDGPCGGVAFQSPPQEGGRQAGGPEDGGGGACGYYVGTGPLCARCSKPPSAHWGQGSGQREP